MKTNDKSIDDRRLADRLAPDAEFGSYHGFWATTYDLNTEFFETDFLPALLNLGSWNDRHWTTRIALEKELAHMSSASVLMDSGRYPGRPHSLRVELLPGRGKSGNALHAKVLVLVHENGVRLHVGSANLTEQGYRHNIEVSACLAASRKNPAQAPLIIAALEEAGNVLKPWWGPGINEVNQKALDLLRSLPSGGKLTDCWFAWGGGETSLLDQFLSHVPEGEEVRSISIVSPFWSEEEGQGPLCTLIDRLRTGDRLATDAEVHLHTSAVPAKENEYLPSLPASYGCCDFRKHGVRAFAHAVSPEVLPAEVMGRDFAGKRALHAKVILVECEKTTLAYLGSANFTRKGWGVLADPATANIEAGIIVLERGKTAEDLSSLISASVGQAVELAGTGKAKLAEPLKEQDESSWPDFLIDVRLAPSVERRRELELCVRIRPERVHGKWSVWMCEKGDEPASVLLSQNGDGESKDTVRVPLTSEQLDRLLTAKEVLVRWWDCETGRLFPVNAALEVRDELPIAPDAGKPGERMLVAYYQGRIPYEELFPPIDLDPAEKPEVQFDSELSGVDTSGIQSYQVREFVESLDGIRSDLRDSAHNERTMKLALLGAVSPVELARQIRDSVMKGERSAMAGGFQLAEILACVREARSLPDNEKWERHRAKAETEIRALLDEVRATYPLDVGAKTVFAKYLHRTVGLAAEN